MPVPPPWSLTGRSLRGFVGCGGDNRSRSGGRRIPDNSDVVNISHDDSVNGSHYITLVEVGVRSGKGASGERSYNDGGAHSDSCDGDKSKGAMR